MTMAPRALHANPAARVIAAAGGNKASRDGRLRQGR